jgi:hypothetical protein
MFIYESLLENKKPGNMLEFESQTAKSIFVIILKRTVGLFVVVVVEDCSFLGLFMETGVSFKH